MQSEGQGLVGPQLRKTATVLLVSFVWLQFFFLFVIMGSTSRIHPLPLSTWFTLPAIYLCPAAIGYSFRRRIQNLQRDGYVSERIANICQDYITGLLSVVYVILLAFRHLA